MNLDIATVESEVARLEKEVAAFKTSQPFYDGQFTMLVRESEDLYDFTITTNHAFTSVDMFLTLYSGQPNMIFEAYFKFMLTDGMVLGANKAQYTVFNKITNVGDAVVNMEINANIFGGIPIGTVIGVKLMFVHSAQYTGQLNVEVRP